MSLIPKECWKKRVISVASRIVFLPPGLVSEIVSISALPHSHLLSTFTVHLHDWLDTADT